MNGSVDVTNYWTVFYTLIGSGAVVVIAGQLFKKLFGLSSGHVIHAMIVCLTIVASSAQYVLQIKHLPPDVLGLSTSSIYGFSQLIYKWAGYANKFLGKVYGQGAPDSNGSAVASQNVAIDASAVKAAEEPSAEFSV